MRRQPHYSFWKLWMDDQRRTWADPYHAIDATAARRAHDEAKQFGWGLGGQYERMVTGLFAEDGNHSVFIAEGAREGEVGRRERWDQR